MKCEICGRPWRGFVDLDTGEFDPPHPDGEMCSKGNPKLRGVGDTADPLPSLIPSPNFAELRERRRAWEEKGEIERKIRAARIRAEIDRAIGSVPGSAVQSPQLVPDPLPAGAVWTSFPVEQSGYLRVVGGSAPVTRSGYLRGGFGGYLEPVAMEGFDVVPGSFVPAPDQAPATEPGIVLRVGEVELPPRFYGYPENGEPTR